MNKIAVIALMMFATAAHACQPTVGAHIGTYHADRVAHYDEINPGAYVMCDGYTAGAYHNSEGGTSAYAGYTAKVGPVDVTIGVVTGYARGIMPMLVPSVRLPVGGLRLAFLPPIPGAKGNTAGIHLMKDF